MAKLNLKIHLDSGNATKQIEKAAKAAERLKVALDKLQQVEIGIKVVEVKPKWWQFWK